RIVDQCRQVAHGGIGIEIGFIPRRQPCLNDVKINRPLLCHLRLHGRQRPRSVATARKMRNCTKRYPVPASPLRPWLRRRTSAVGTDRWITSDHSVSSHDWPPTTFGNPQPASKGGGRPFAVIFAAERRRTTHMVNWLIFLVCRRPRSLTWQATRTRQRCT